MQTDCFNRIIGLQQTITKVVGLIANISSHMIEKHPPPNLLLYKCNTPYSAKFLERKILTFLSRQSTVKFSIGFTVTYCMAGNIGVELYLAIGEMKPVLPNFNAPI